MTIQAATPIRARALAAAAILAGALALAGCTAAITFDPFDVTPTTVSTSSGAGYRIVQVPDARPPSGIEVRSPGAPTVYVPANYYPAPGMCRVWLPNVPLGQQNAPGACDDLERRVPPDAYLIYG